MYPKVSWWWPRRWRSWHSHFGLLLLGLPGWPGHEQGRPRDLVVRFVYRFDSVPKLIELLLRLGVLRDELDPIFVHKFGSVDKRPWIVCPSRCTGQGSLELLVRLERRHMKGLGVEHTSPISIDDRIQPIFQAPANSVRSVHSFIASYHRNNSTPSMLLTGDLAMGNNVTNNFQSTRAECCLTKNREHSF